MPETRAERRSVMNRDHARELRNNSTRAERWLWQSLSRLKAEGLRFRRQQPIGPYIADFCCLSRKLIIELDGNQHYRPETAAYDAERTLWLEEHGYTVLRFANADVIEQRHIVIDGVLAQAKKQHVEKEE